MKFLSTVFRYVISIFLILMAIGLAASKAYVMAAVVLAVAAVVLPPVWARYIEPTGRQKLAGYGAAAAVFFAVVIAGGQAGDKRRLEHELAEQAKRKADAEYFVAHRDEVVAQARKLIADKQYAAAVALTSRYAMAGDADLRMIAGKANAQLKQDADKREISTLREQLNGLTDVGGADALKIYERLAELDSDPTWKKLAADVKQKIERRKLVEGQFSAWDGSHVKLALAVKKAMHDPDSFEHVETRYLDKGDYIAVWMKFRGKNGFNATVLGNAYGEFSLNGTPIKIQVD